MGLKWNVLDDVVVAQLLVARHVNYSTFPERYSFASLQIAISLLSLVVDTRKTNYTYTFSLECGRLKALK